jgi:hypothetical protein
LWLACQARTIAAPDNQAVGDTSARTPEVVEPDLAASVAPRQ